MALAFSALSDKALPCLAPPPAEGAPPDDADALPTITGFGMLQDMSMVDVLDESMAYVAEALSLWSKAHRDNHFGRVSEWSGVLVGALSFYDKALSMYLQAVVSGGGLHEALDPGAAESDMRPEALQEHVAVFGRVSAGLQAYMVDESRLRQFLERAQTFICVRRILWRRPSRK